MENEINIFLLQFNSIFVSALSCSMFKSESENVSEYFAIFFFLNHYKFRYKINFSYIKLDNCLKILYIKGQINKANLYLLCMKVSKTSQVGLFIREAFLSNVKDNPYL